MHAASVHPEPGSNSRIIVFNQLPLNQIFTRAYLLLAFLFPKIYFSWVLYSSKNFSRFVFRTYNLLCTSLCYSIVKDQCPLPFFAAAWLLYHSVFDLSRGFSKVFWKIFDFFRSVFQTLAMIPVALATCIFYHFRTQLSSVSLAKVYRFYNSFLCMVHKLT